MFYFRSYEACGVFTAKPEPFEGVVVYGDDGENFVALDGRNGKALWHFNLGQLVHASPMSYAIDGKQYFAVAAGSDVFAFALP
jgi:alcohol dehydrogenase (cytochrome c)